MLRIQRLGWNYLKTKPISLFRYEFFCMNANIGPVFPQKNGRITCKKPTKLRKKTLFNNSHIHGSACSRIPSLEGWELRLADWQCPRQRGVSSSTRVETPIFAQIWTIFLQVWESSRSAPDLDSSKSALSRSGERKFSMRVATGGFWQERKHDQLPNAQGRAISYGSILKQLINRRFFTACRLVHKQHPHFPTPSSKSLFILCCQIKASSFIKLFYWSWNQFRKECFNCEI